MSGDYRDDDLRQKGWCPFCAAEVTQVMTDGSGWCPEHGKVYLNWAPPNIPSDEEIIDWVAEHYGEQMALVLENQIYGSDDIETIAVPGDDEKDSITWPMVERVEGGAWVLARVWVPIDEEEHE